MIGTSHVTFEFNLQYTISLGGPPGTENTIFLIAQEEVSVLNIISCTVLAHTAHNIVWWSTWDRKHNF